VFSGGWITGNVCWQITSTDVGSLVVYYEPSYPYDAKNRVFFSLTAGR
jgi:hypothetical protein